MWCCCKQIPLIVIQHRSSTLIFFKSQIVLNQPMKNWWRMTSQIYILSWMSHLEFWMINVFSFSTTKLPPFRVRHSTNILSVKHFSPTTNSTTKHPHQRHLKEYPASLLISNSPRNHQLLKIIHLHSLQKNSCNID